MTEFNLIPPDYHQRFHRRRLLLGYLLTYATLCLGGFVAFTHVQGELRGLRSEVAQSQSREQLSVSKAEQLRELDEDIERLQAQVHVLDGLRGGVAARQMFGIIDAAIHNNIWLQRWRFARAGESVDETEIDEHVGYLVVIPAGVAGKQDQTWRLVSHMQVSGQALSHAALAEFVARLLEHSEIDDVQILRAAVDRADRAGMVGFELAIRIQESHDSARRAG